MEGTMADARALAERLSDILDNGRYDEFTTVVAEDVVKVELPVTTHSAAEWAAGHQAFAAAVPDTRNTITRCVQDGDDFAVEGHGRGTQTGPLQLPRHAGTDTYSECKGSKDATNGYHPRRCRYRPLAERQG
jgi:ketosteroid isomerase-like protein